ncbi:MAG: hypothetical protein NUW37_00530 [Planctomycetes bacterium]|nr:hypothetical protein [Planctomycetota bacterium]
MSTKANPWRRVVTVAAILALSQGCKSPTVELNQPAQEGESALPVSDNDGGENQSAAAEVSSAETAGEAAEDRFSSGTEEPVNQPTTFEFDKLWNWDDFAGTESAFTELLAQLDADRSSDKNYRLALMTQIARVQGLQKNFEAAHATLDSVEKELAGASAVVRVRYLLERGRTLRSSGNPDASTALFKEAHEVATKAGETVFAADAAHMVAIVLSGTPEGFEWAEKTMQICKASDNPRLRGWLGPLYHNTGWSYIDVESFEKALELFYLGVEFHEEIGSDMPLLIAKYDVAVALRKLHRVDDALKILEELRLAHQQRTEENDQVGFVYEEIAECLHIKDRNAEARAYFALAYNELSKTWVREEEPERLQRLADLGGIARD